MSRHVVIWTIVVIFVVIILTGSFYLFVIKKIGCTITRCTQITEQKSETEKIREVKKTPISLNSLHVTGWIPDWDYADGFTTLKEQVSTFGSISPFLYELQTEGTLKEMRFEVDQELIDFTAQNDIELVPTITGFDANIISDMLNNESSRDTHIAAIVETVTSHNFDGIDLDYESVYYADKEVFFSFLETLSYELHSQQKKLVFTAVAKWGDEDVTYSYAPQTRAVFDYKRLADLADELRVMTYDYTSRDSMYHGPVGPIGWAEDVIRYAIYAGVPREKLVLGVPTYGFDWTERPAIPRISYSPFIYMRSDENMPSARAYYRESLDEIFAVNEVATIFNDEWGEAVGTYINEDGEKRVVVYPTQESLDLRKQLAADYGIKGVAYWRLGDGGELQY